ncbi:transcriptional regulator, AraC family [Enterococcus faecium PC4.1]|nr:transcriptional regulator, AraC family [Enterococcus faecium PC4.1]
MRKKSIYNFYPKNIIFHIAIFTEKFGINFSKYLKKVRISKAKLFLTETRLTLTEICEKVGYTELGYFSRVFKEETGMTPSQYRKETFVK